jgi:hypothetical protein
MGTLFALFVVFTAAEVWADNDQATGAVAREASELREALILATAFPGKAQGELETLIHDHIEEVATQEWPQMGHRSLTLGNVPPNLVEALQLTLALTPSSPGQVVAQHELVTALESAMDARRQRVLISHLAVGFAKWSCLAIQAVCVLIAIALTHGDKRTAALVAMLLFATGVAACFLLVLLYDRPFTGQFLVKPDPLVQIMPRTLATPAP